MATTNTTITCDHCFSKIRVRAGIGYSKRQPFSFACKKCGTIIKGALIAESDNIEFEFTNASEKPFDLNDADFIVECHEDFLLTNEPAYRKDPQTGEIIPKPSPFMITAKLMGQNFLEFSADMSLFLLNQRELKNKLFRINNFYIYDRESEFKEESENLISTESQIETYKSLVQLNEMYFIPILKKENVYSNCSFFKNKVLNILTNKRNELMYFIEELEQLNFFENQIKENLILMERFDELFFEIKPIINLNYIKSIDTDKLMFSILNFDKIKQFYVDLFECVGRELNCLIGLRNLEVNGDHNKLNLPDFNRIRNYQDCMSSSNGNKKKYLEDSLYFNLIRDVFDHQLRNGLGHYKCVYNQISKTVEYYPHTKDLNKSRKETISYVDFVSKLYNLFNLFVSLIYLRTLLYTVYFANKSVLPLGIKDVSLLTFNKFPPSFKNINLVVDNNPPVVCLNHFWTGVRYTHPDILNHDFSYWDFTHFYEKFGFCDENSIFVDIKFEDETLCIEVNKTKVFKFKIYEHIEWYNILMNMGGFSSIQRMEKTEIPYFNVVPRIPQLLQSAMK
ncbi:hypothetical protein [Methanosarcina mazei]|uniref:Uncharacterized protein n=2 Tax=Methanosarcina mazei TaxID=2209 RepID=A0A0F8I0F2_METMZ|nr:hypothetical protein [Methanosarcina mazei]AKB40078.1 hypothetical protein MSMAW_1087 [Methanosarcina mazei WWM610]KKG82451.1 hypothetical protein DU55_02935 [Methanosarcina mazei]KKG94630.1 hypothetical protein DU69_19845 [Methanosarcina mazei]KKH61200.1 hypothetical protein DU74_07320 [Methanosarcina mazei]